MHISNLTFIPRVCSFGMCFCCIHYYVDFNFLGIVCMLFTQQHLQVKVDNRDPPEPWKCDVILVVTIASRERVRNQVTAFRRNLKILHLKAKDSSSKPNHPFFWGFHICFFRCYTAPMLSFLPIASMYGIFTLKAIHVQPDLRMHQAGRERLHIRAGVSTYIYPLLGCPGKWS